MLKVGVGGYGDSSLRVKEGREGIIPGLLCQRCPPPAAVGVRSCRLGSAACRSTPQCLSGPRRHSQRSCHLGRGRQESLSPAPGAKVTRERRERAGAAGGGHGGREGVESRGTIPEADAGSREKGFHEAPRAGRAVPTEEESGEQKSEPGRPGLPRKRGEGLGMH